MRLSCSVRDTVKAARNQAGACRVHTPVRKWATQWRMSCLAFSPTTAGELLSCGTPQSAIALWDCEAGSSVRTFSDHQQRVWALAYSAQQPHVFASASDDCTFKLWSTNQAASTMSVDLGANVCCVAASPWDANVFAVGTAGHTMNVYDVRHARKPLAHFSGARVYLVFWVLAMEGRRRCVSCGTCMAPASMCLGVASVLALRLPPLCAARCCLRHAAIGTQSLCIAKTSTFTATASAVQG